MQRIVYLVTTKGCESCRIMENILNKVFNCLSSFTIEVKEFNELPFWIKTNVAIKDFPTLIFVEENVIKYHCSGTISFKNLMNIIKDIHFD